MTSTERELLCSRRFLPLFLTQFLGAANDNLFKNALVLLVTYRLAGQAGLNGQIMATLAAGIFILPFFLFSATAGRFADRFEKSRLITCIKAAEILIMILGVAGLGMESVTLLFVTLFLMGVHSSFFGPLKYAILPAHLAAGELLAGNALVETGTYIAILAGTILGGIAAGGTHSVGITAILVLGTAVLGFAASLRIPRAHPADPGLKLGFNPWRDTAEILRDAAAEPEIFAAILGNSWFWLVGATYLSQFPTYAKDVIGADAHVVTLFLATFTIGIGLGSLLCGRFGKRWGNGTALWTVPIGAIGISVFGLDLFFAGPAIPAGSDSGGDALGIAAFLARGANWRILADLTFIAAAGGLYIVPLYTLLQTGSEEGHRARIIAANNVWNALLMVAAAIATTAMLTAGFTVPDVFLTVAVANAGVAWHFCRRYANPVTDFIRRHCNGK